MRILATLLLFISSAHLAAQDHITLFEKTKGKQSPVYTDIISWWKKLDAHFPTVKMMEMGPTDAGYPLHLVLVSSDKDFDIASLKKKKKTIIFINNGIHPGEPDGIDATMLLVKNLVTKKAGTMPEAGQVQSLPSNVVLAIIPVYNIGGALNRSKNYRIDQNGPEEKGFRGNSQNLDLNRDFIKMDSKEAFTFSKIFHYLDPDIFIDNHVSNGADYQHVMTLLTSQHNRSGGDMGAYLNREFEPAIYRIMKGKGWDLVPYVNHFGDTPDKGWTEFWDSPRYSSGYTSLFNTFSFVPETHMLKPYEQRVASTKALMESFIEFAAANGTKIAALRAEAKKRQAAQTMFPLHWKLDRTQPSQITFKGYEAGRKPSEVSGLPRLYYDKTKPFEKKVPFYNIYRDTFSVSKPLAYIIPQGWWKVIERLQANRVQMRRLAKDTTIEVESYRIGNYTTSPRPWEGHHINAKVELTKHTYRIKFRKGDYYIPMNQAANRFIIETLEPQGEDSYFAWNFFDASLGQKEGFSDYVFEETAAAYLKANPDVRAKLEERKATDSTFAKSAQAQLTFVYQNSPYYEPSHMAYPVYRVVK